jgi:hypothetical protein
MKTTLKIAAILLAVATLTLAACKKDDPQPEPQPQPEPEPQQIDLSITTWESSFQNTYMYQGVMAMNIDAVMQLDFFDSENGEFFTDMVIEVPDYPSANQTQNVTEPFTYTFDGTTLVLTSTEEGAEEGDMGEMTYDRSNNTLYQIIPDITENGINLRELYGSDRIVFHLINGNFGL